MINHATSTSVAAYDHAIDFYAQKVIKEIHRMLDSEGVLISDQIDRKITAEAQSLLRRVIYKQI